MVSEFYEKYGDAQDYDRQTIMDWTQSIGSKWRINRTEVGQWARDLVTDLASS